MNALAKCWEELSKARIAIEDMRDAIDLNAHEGHWQDFLFRLERSWNKSVSYMKANRRFHGWSERGDAIALREHDPLLSYLRYARGAAEHTVEAIVLRVPGVITVSAVDRKSMMDLEVSIPDGNGIVTDILANAVTSVSVVTLLPKTPEEKSVVANQPVRFDLEPAKLKLIQITNRGRTYRPPASHLGKPLNELGPIEAAELGMTFYGSYYRKAEDSCADNKQHITMPSSRRATTARR